MDNNLNLDENTMNNIKNMVDNGNISDALSNISPEMIANFSKLMSSQNANTSTNENSQNNTNVNTTNSNNENTNNPTANPVNINGFNLNNMDMNTMMKLTSALGSMNNSNDPRSNLLYSLKPYLRDGKKQKLDQYSQLLNFTKIADIMKNDKKEKE